MTLQAALGAVLLIGLPILLLAVGVLAHAYYLARPRAAAKTDHLIEELVAQSVEQLLAQLQAEPRPRAPQAPMALQAARQDMPLAPAGSAPVHPMHSFAALNAPAPSFLPAPNLRMAVVQLLSEGLSDRSIARRLGIGIEEVRAARIHDGPGNTAAGNAA